jgi:hypothetical protein
VVPICTPCRSKLESKNIEACLKELGKRMGVERSTHDAGEKLIRKEVPHAAVVKLAAMSPIIRASFCDTLQDASFFWRKVDLRKHVWIEKRMLKFFNHQVIETPLWNTYLAAPPSWNPSHSPPKPPQAIYENGELGSRSSYRMCFGTCTGRIHEWTFGIETTFCNMSALWTRNAPLTNQGSN